MLFLFLISCNMLHATFGFKRKFIFSPHSVYIYSMCVCEGFKCSTVAIANYAIKTDSLTIYLIVAPIVTTYGYCLPH